MSDQPKKGKPRGRNGGRHREDPNGSLRETYSWRMTPSEFEHVGPIVNDCLDSLRKQPQNSEWTEN